MLPGILTNFPRRCASRVPLKGTIHAKHVSKNMKSKYPVSIALLIGETSKMYMQKINIYHS